MKSLIIIFLAINSITQIFSQKSIDPYYESLCKHILSFGTPASSYIDTFFVRKQDYHPSYHFTLGGFQITTVDETLLYNKTKKHRHLLLTVISPISIEQDKKVIYVTNFDVYRKKKRYSLSGSDATKTYLAYDCKVDDFLILKEYPK